jgi:riboflavin kinase / FMN adenylyltransferase
MQVLGASRSLPLGGGPYAVGIGIFDGVHRGHMLLLQKVLELARTDGYDSLAYTFHPHPAQILSPSNAPRLIEPIEIRLERLAALGFSATLVEPFSREFAELTAEHFVTHVLARTLQAKHVVVGADFVFGRGRTGNLELLRSKGAELGFQVHGIDIAHHDGVVVSSSAIRERVRSGDVEGAAALLGRPFSFEGVVMRGHQRGTGLGFPTANVETHNELLPAAGVYAGYVSGPFDRRPAVINVGVAPTFDVGRLRVEAHVLDFPFRPLYGLVLSVELVQRLRGEMKFDGPEALRAQIGKDIEAARGVLNAPAKQG